MSFLWKALKGGGKVAKGAIGMRSTLPFFGAAAGGIYGGMSSENLSPDAKMRDALTGAAAGFGIGSLATNTFWKALGGVGKGVKNLAARPYRRALQTTMGSSKVALGKSYQAQLGLRAFGQAYGRPAKKAGLGAINLAAGLTKRAMDNPFTALAVGGGVLSVASMMSQDTRPLNAQELSSGLEKQGLPSTGYDPSRAELHNSTYGLVQSMHKGRHG